MYPHSNSASTDIPENLSCTKGPPGHQILSIQQHTGLGAHKEHVLASFPRDIHQVANSSRARQEEWRRWGLGGGGIWVFEMSPSPRQACWGYFPQAPWYILMFLSSLA